MAEQGTDRYGAEYKRTDNDFNVRYLEQDNCVCSVCHGTGAKIEIRYVVRNYASARAKKKICKNLQAHERSLWICPKCINNLEQKISVINERNLTQPKPCPYCGGNAIRKQCHFKASEGESRYKNEHHDDGSLKWTWLECDSCGRATDAYCYEYQATDCWNNGKAERREWIKALSASKTERKTGTWQRKYSRPGVYADLCWHCSICGGKFSDTYANMWKYCPDCGSYNGGNNDDNS